MLILRHFLLLALLHKGNTQTSCDASEGTVLICKFSRNVNATQTDFSVYFHFDIGHEEMLVDCVWLIHKLQCLKQEGFDVKQQVSETAEISIATRFVSANGTYKCNLEGLKTEKGNPCRSDEKRQEKQQEIQSNQFNGSFHENHPDDKAAENNIPLIAGGVSGAAFAICILGLIIKVTCRKRHEAGTSNSNSNSHLLESNTSINDPTSGDRHSDNDKELL